MASIVTLARGKNGIGNAAIGVNLAICLANLGQRTCLFGTDLTDSGLEIPETRRPAISLDEVIASKKPIKEALVRAWGIDIIPSSRALETMEGPSAAKLLQALSGLAHYDFLVLDLAASRVKLSYHFLLASPEALLVISPETESVTDAFSLLKVLFFNGYSGSVKAVVTRSGNPHAAKAALTKLRDLAQQHLRLNLAPLGVIVYDDKDMQLLKEKKPFVLLSPGSDASRTIQGIARYLLERKGAEGKDAEMGAFFGRLLPMIGKPLKLTGAIPPTPKIEGSPAAETPGQVEPGLEPQPLNSATRASSVPAEAREVIASAEIQSVLNRLAEGVSALSRELEQIRMTLKPPARLTEEEEMVPIDFEAYLRNKKTNPKEKME